MGKNSRIRFLIVLSMRRQSECKAYKFRKRSQKNVEQAMPKLNEMIATQ